MSNNSSVCPPLSEMASYTMPISPSLTSVNTTAAAVVGHEHLLIANGDSVLPTSSSTPQYLSAVEFLKSTSGSMTYPVVFFLQQEEKPHDFHSFTKKVLDDNNKNRSNKKSAENAAKLALLITRSFLKFVQEVNNEDSSAAALQLDDFYISFLQETMILCGQEGGEPSSNYRSDYLNSRLNINGGKEIMTIVVITLLEVDIISPKILKQPQDHHTPPEAILEHQPPHDQVEQQERRKQQQNSSSKQPLFFALSHNMQVLGRILYSIFCHGRPLPPDIIHRMTTSSQEVVDKNEDQYDDRTSSVPASKSSRVSKETVFTRLMEQNTNGLLPKSVCQFLADMIDTTVQEQEQQPDKSMLSNDPTICLPFFEDDDVSNKSQFTCFEDVIMDLEQMIFQPEIFLHNEDKNLPSPRSSLIMFGQKYHSRNNEVATLMKLAIQMMDNQHSHSPGVIKAVLVSGIAGSGKSKLIQTVGEHVSSLQSWIVVKAKFERGQEHASRNIVLSMFNDIGNYLLRMKESGNVTEVAISTSVSRSILNSVGYGTLVEIVDFLPSLAKLLFDDGILRHDAHVDQSKEAANSWRRLSFLLTNILGAVLKSDQYIMICCDDIQWADKTSILLMNEVLAMLGLHKHIRHRCLFVGMYRSDELIDSHPFTTLQSCLKRSSSVYVTEIELSSLSKEGVVDMLMEEFRLPRRLVLILADVVHKKTAGHAYFVVEFLNSLLRDSIVTYSSLNCRYSWDEARISIIDTGDSVAELIATNIKSLPKESQQILQVLSCFGTQMDDSLLEIVDRFHEGIVSSIDTFVESGILDKAASIVIFSHDLIQEAVYQSLELEEQKSLHLRLGQYLGAIADDTLAIETVTNVFGRLGLEEDQVFFSGRAMTSSLISIACDQVNAGRSDSFSDESMNVKFARWNLSSGQTFASQSNFCAALFYYSNGIEFLGKYHWSLDQDLYCELHHGAVLASFALGEASNVEMYAKTLIDKVPFEDSLEVQKIALKSLAQTDRHQECISIGIDILKQLGFNIPHVPSKEGIANAVVSTANNLSRYSSDHLESMLCERTSDESVYAAAKIADSLYVSLHTTSSPFLPFVACETVNLSLEKGCCPEAANSFATLAFFKVFIQEDYPGARFLANLARRIIKNNPKKNKNSEIRAEILLHITIDNYFHSPVDVSTKLIKCHNVAMKIGQADSAILALTQAWRFRLLGGHHLSLVLQSFEERLKLAAKHDQYSTKYMALDAIFLMKLTGKSINVFSVFEDSISSLDSLRSEAESSNDIRWLHNFHVYKCLMAFFEGDIITAEEHLHIALAYPASKMPRLITIYQSFFGGLVALQSHCRDSSTNQERLQYGIDMMKTLEKWTKNAKEIFHNKWLLLKAEYNASVGKNGEALQFYLASIETAKDHGIIHELALALELLGYHYCSIEGNGSNSNECFRKAVVYYEQWGATAVAERLRHTHNLQTHPDTCADLQPGSPQAPGTGSVRKYGGE